MPKKIYITGVKYTHMKQGYTLIEVLTTITIFLLISGAIFGLFTSSLVAQRKALASQKIFDNVSYVIEYMSRALRMALKDDIGGVNCLLVAQDKSNFEITHSGSGIKFREYKGTGCQEFYLEAGRLKENKEGTINFLTPDKMKINSLKFDIFGENQVDEFQPRVTIFLDMETTGAAVAKIQIQTTISQRNLDVLY